MSRTLKLMLVGFIIGVALTIQFTGCITGGPLTEPEEVALEGMYRQFRDCHQIPFPHFTKDADMVIACMRVVYDAYSSVIDSTNALD